MDHAQITNNVVCEGTSYIASVPVPARLGKGQGVKYIGQNLACKRPKFGHNLVRERQKIRHNLERERPKFGHSPAQ